MLDAFKKYTGSVKDLEGLKKNFGRWVPQEQPAAAFLDDMWNVDCEKWMRLYKSFNKRVTRGKGW